MSAAEVVMLALVAVLGSSAQSATGFGVALPVAPVAFASMPPADAALSVVVGSLMHNLLVLVTRKSRLDFSTRDGALLIAAAMPGLLLGSLVVSRVPGPAMQLAVGFAILLAVLFRLHHPGRARTLARRGAGVPIGLVAGVLTTTVGINGPPLVIWLRARSATLGQLRDTLAMIFLVLNVAAIASLAARGATVPLTLMPALAAGLVTGHVLGVVAHRRLSSRVLDRALVAILLAAACASVAAGGTAVV